MRRVIDAAVAIKWFIEEDRSDAALDIVSSGALLYAPHLILIEVAATFMKKVRRQEINADFARSAEQTFRQRATAGLITLWPDETLLSDAIELSLRLAHPLYDCIYLAQAAELLRLLGQLPADLDGITVSRLKELLEGDLLAADELVEEGDTNTPSGSPGGGA